MMKITGLSHVFKWENLHNWWLTKYFFAPLYTPPLSAGRMRSVSSPLKSFVMVTQAMLSRGL